jgi:hypothetical protein
MSCNVSGTPFAVRKKTTDELRLQLVSSKKMTPLTYLSVESKLRYDRKLVTQAGLYRYAEYSPDGATILGTIKNSATMAKFKDVGLSLTCFSQTKTNIETKEFV